MKIFLVFLALFCSSVVFAQKGKNGAFTVTAPNMVLNTYTELSQNAISPGATSIQVQSNSLISATLTSPLAAGDLIMIVQMGGTTANIVSSFGVFSYSQEAANDPANQDNYLHRYGEVNGYRDAGHFEYAEVLSVSGSNTIQLRCPIQKSYEHLITGLDWFHGRVQIVRIPRYSSLNLNPNTSVVASAWNGVTGGVVALEVEGNVVFGNGSRISASGLGFRGGVVENFSNGPTTVANTVGKPGYSSVYEGAEKGEGVFGYATGEYANFTARYGMGAIANGGGGGNYKNAGGGGGSNVGAQVGYTGKGVPVPGFASYWNLELAGMATSNSPGGGRGGYSGAQSDQNELTVGPNNSLWQADMRRKEGGLGGHPLAYDVNRIFMGGGGGAGEMDNGQGGSGGNGGGLVFLQFYGNVTGTGIIEANGANGQHSNPNGEAPTNGNSGRKGVDAAGGGGGGGSIYLSNGVALPNSISLSARGGNGGNNNISYGSYVVGQTPTLEADGPGGGGAGGFINYTSGSPNVSVAGGASGVVNITGSVTTNIVANFPPNGATNGNSGMNLVTVPFYNLIANHDTICNATTATISVTPQGTLPVANSAINWYASYTSTTSLGTGLTFTTPVLNTTTTYYVGFCPNGTFRVPVTVTVGGPTIAGTAVVTNATCTAGGSITGLTTSGGLPTVNIFWNNVNTGSTTLANASADTYTLTVTDAAGCSATSGPYVITSTGGPTVNSTNMIVTNANCNGTGGSITGIVANGTGLTYSWNAGAYTTLPISGLSSGQYTLTVTDANNCDVQFGPVTVGQNSGPVINTTNADTIQTTCGDSNGAITGLTISGGTPQYSYSWNSGAFATLDLTDLGPGNYSLVVTDANNCTATFGPVTINPSASLSLNAAGISIADDHCSQYMGSISGITVSGGQAPLAYSWNSGVYNTLNIANLSTGDYTLLVMDANGCDTTVGPFSVSNIAGPTVSTAGMTITPESCQGNDGAIEGITTNSTSNLTYYWNGTQTQTLDQTDLTAGTYALIVTDAFNCSATSGPFLVNGAIAMTVSQTNMVVTPTGCVGNTGAINGIQVTGGINPIYSWSNGASTLNISSLAAGTYTLTVTDNQNCSQVVTVNVPNTSGITLNTNNVVVTNDLCGNNTGSITGITVSGGTPNFTYVWDGNAALNTIDLTGLSTGNHTLVVTDAAGCTATTTHLVGTVSAPVIDQTNMVIVPEDCIGNNGGISGIQVTGNGPFTYAWIGTPMTSIDITNLESGTYTLTVTDVNNCSTSSGPIVVTETGGIVADFTISNTMVSPGDIITFTDASSGGVVQTYNWVITGEGTISTSSNCTYSNAVDGTYVMTLTVVSTLGCVDSISKTFQILGELSIPNIITVNGDHINDEFYITNLKPNSRLVILNRWGNLVYETDSYTNDWKGEDYTGAKMEDGVYFYQLITADGKMWQGNVQLLID